jgi:hypothetical protein
MLSDLRKAECKSRHAGFHGLKTWLQAEVQTNRAEIIRSPDRTGFNELRETEPSGLEQSLLSIGYGHEDVLWKVQQGGYWDR